MSIETERERETLPSIFFGYESEVCVSAERCEEAKIS